MHCRRQPDPIMNRINFQNQTASTELHPIYIHHENIGRNPRSCLRQRTDLPRLATLISVLVQPDAVRHLIDCYISGEILISAIVTEISALNHL